MRLLALAIIFTLGLAAGLYFAHAETDTWQETPDSALLQTFQGVTDKAAPSDRITERQIIVYSDRVILDIQHAEWARFTDTKSMEPVLTATTNAIELPPTGEDDVQEGDICSYRSEYADGDIIHRVVYKGADEEGTYYVFKGDNLAASDPGRVRFSQIRRCVVAIIY